MTKKQQSILIEANEEQLDCFVPLDENDELCEFFRIFHPVELDLF